MQGVDLARTVQEHRRLFVQAFRKYSYEAGQHLSKDIKTNMKNGPQTGREYKTIWGVGGKLLKDTRTRIASAADEYPAIWTGNLRDSVDFKVVGATKTIIGARAKYADYLENGTKDGKIAPRNYLKNTIKNQTPVLQAKADKDIERIMSTVIKY